MIQGYKEGSDITIINTLYLKPQKLSNGKYIDDRLLIIYKDNITGKKNFQLIEKPDYEYFKLKDNVMKQDYTELFTDINNVNSVRVPYKDLEKHLAKEAGLLDEYFDNIRNGNPSSNQRMHIKDTSVFNSDMNIEDNYRYRFNKMYKNNIIPITKSFLDIEADTIDMMGDFPEPGECPVNAVTYIDMGKNISYTFLLRNNDNPLIQEFEDSINENLFNELKEFVYTNVGGIKQAKKYGIDKLDFQFLFYDDELQMLHDLFILINQNEPDFLLAWNMAFDIPYIIERLKKFGCPPEDIMCHKDSPVRVARYYIDERNINEFAERGDFATIGCKTIYLDQLIHFMSRRKGTKFDSAKLDYIGEITVGVNKLDYSHITTQISELPYKDYKTFVFYNIMDVIVQVCIEAKVQDIDYIFAKAISNNTRYHKIHRQTIFLVNRATQSFYDNGFIIGNNANKFNPKPKDKFPGALVGNPLNNSDYSKMKINGYATNNISGNKVSVEDISTDWLKEALRIKYADKITSNNKLDIRFLSDEDRRIVEGVSINICNNMIDLDFSSLYPSTERQNNMAPNTQIGRIVIDHKVHDKENPFDYEAYVSGGQFIEDFISQNYIEFCERWLHLAGFKDMINDIKEYFSSVIYLPQVNMFNRNGNINIVTVTDKNTKSKVVTMREKGFKTQVVSRKVPIVNHSELRNELINQNTKFMFRS